MSWWKYWKRCKVKEAEIKMDVVSASKRTMTIQLWALLSLIAMVLAGYQDGFCIEWKVVTKKYEPSEVLYTIQDEDLKRHSGFYFPEFRTYDEVLYSGFRPIEDIGSADGKSEYVWEVNLGKEINLNKTVFFFNRIYVENIDRYTISLHLSKNDIWLERDIAIRFSGYQLPIEVPLSSWLDGADKSSTENRNIAYDTIDEITVKMYPTKLHYDFVIGDFKLYSAEWVDKDYTHPLFEPILKQETEHSLDFQYTPPGIPLITSSIAFRSLIGHNGDPYFIVPDRTTPTSSYTSKDLRELKTTMTMQFLDKYPFYEQRGLVKENVIKRFKSFTNSMSREAFNDSLISLVNSFNDQHFGAYYLSDVLSAKPRPVPPVLFYEIQGQIRVAAVLASELKTRIEPGMTLVRVQGKPIQDHILEQSNRHYGSVFSRRKKAISSLLRDIPDSVGISISLESNEGGTVTIDILSNRESDYKIPVNFVPKHGEFRVLEGNIAYFRLRGWTLDVWTRFINNIPILESANGLIIDLRSNSGGENASVMRFLSLFVDNPILYGRAYCPANGKIEDLIVRPNDRYHIGIPVVILGNGQTACASEDFIDVMQHETHAVFVADRKTSGAASAVIRIVFPDGLVVAVNSWSNRISPSRGVIEGRGIDPDIQVNIESVDDLAHRKDKMLKVAANLLRKKISF